MRQPLFVSALCFLLSVSAFAAPASSPSYTVSAPASAKALGVADTSNVTTSQSLSALFSSGNDWIQAFLGVNRTQGTFEFGAGGMYKFTVAGNSRTGFHVGPGVSLGTVAAGGKSKFAFGIYGVVGGHFTIFDRLILSVDAGPILTVIDGDANFAMKPVGDLLGLSVHYLF